MVLGFADEMKKLGENIAASYNVRIGSVKDILKGTHTSLKQFHTDHMHMSEEQKADLARFRKELGDETKKMLDDAKKLMNSISSSNKKMAAELHSSLEEFRDSFLKAQNQFHNMLDSYYKGEIKKPVADMLSAYANQKKKLAEEFQRAHNAWTSISRSMSVKKRGMKAPAEAIAPKAHAPKPRGRKKRKYSRKKK